MPIEPSNAQRRRLTHFDAPESVDVHCHILSGVDDGPATPEETLQLCRALVEDGITTVIATPHELGRYDGRNSAASVRAACTKLQEELTRNGIPLVVKPGADVRVDERIAGLLKMDEILTLGDGRVHLLLELPHETYIDPLMLVRLLVSRGLQPVISHPERHAAIRARLSRVTPWVEQGAVLQVTAGSLLGQFGPDAQAAGWRLLEAGVVALVATDAHDTQRRPPCMTQAAAAIEKRLGYAVARLVCVENPLRVLQGRRCSSRNNTGVAQVV